VISFLADFHASPFLMPESAKELKTPEISGLKLSTWYVELRQNFAFLKTCLGYFPPVISGKFSMTWPKAGMVYDGEFFPQPNWVRRISETGSGLLHTPTIHDASGIKRTQEGWEKRAAFRKSIGRDHIAPAGLSEQIWLEDQGIPLMISKWPTPQARDWKGSSGRSLKGQERDLPTAVSGILNPDWVEILMGFPLSWTSLNPIDPSEFSAWLYGFKDGEVGRTEQEARYSSAAWQDGSWEDGILRTVKGRTKNRIDRLKGIGNAQVSLVAAAAWRLLTEE
jgi:hypothetical protein